MLLQNGFDFPWIDAVLIPGNKVFASPWLPHDEPVEIGKTDEWVTVCCGPWTIHLRLQADGRFPNVDSVVPAESGFTTRLHFGQSDADFLAQAMKRLPVDDDLNSPVTLDLNGRVLVRATADDQPQPAELELTNSRVTGEAVCANTNRHLLTRAVRLGFRAACFSGPETPVFCQDAHRRYVWMLLTKEGLIASSSQANCIASPVDATAQAASTQNTHSFIDLSLSHCLRCSEQCL